MKLANTCTRCPRLVNCRHRIVWGRWADNRTHHGLRVIMFIGEAPGEHEDRQGKPFVGMTGQEVDALLKRHGLYAITYLTNVVKCHPPGNVDPTPEEIANCGEWLRQEIKMVSPSLIVTAGRYSSRAVLGRDDFTMEMVSGVFYQVPGVDCPVMPLVHPAAGFHRQKNMSFVVDGFKRVGQWKRGEIGAGQVRELPGAVEGKVYRVAEGGKDVYNYLQWAGMEIAFDENGYEIEVAPSFVAIDTEDGPGDVVWCLQISVRKDTALMIMADDDDALREFNDYLITKNPLTVIHSALHDIPKLATLGLHPKRVFDTMVAAYLLQDEPLGLKPLAWRIVNEKMQKYVEVIASAKREKALGYLSSVLSCPDNTIRKWPELEPLLVTEKGIPRIKQPQNISKKVARIVGDVKKGKVTKDGPVDPRKRWLNIAPEEGRAMVEDELGLMPNAYLCDIPIDDAVQYACMDADMTLAIYPYLSQRIEDEGLALTMDTEMGVMRFVTMMHEYGIPTDAGHFHTLSGELAQEMERIEKEITTLTGFTGQLSSHQQVSSLLYDPPPGLNLRRHLPKKRSKKAGKTMTGNDILAQIEHHHPVVGLIREYRKVEKLKNTYTDGVPRHIKSDRRVHADFRTTNTDTGRLSCADPNLMAQPKRNKVWAKKIRNGFRAEDGCVIVSMDYCLTGDAKVITQDGHVMMKHLAQRTDKMWALSCPTPTSVEFKPITNAAKIGKAEVYQVVLEDGGIVKCTADHKWMSYDGDMIETRHLEPGTRLAHVKTSYAGRNKYPTWYMRQAVNYTYKHHCVAKGVFGPPPNDGQTYEIDHRDGDIQNWKAYNLRYLLEEENRRQGGRRYWRSVKNGDRSDDNRLNGLREGLKKRRSYKGRGNPNYGKRKGKPQPCKECGKMFYEPPSRKYVRCKECRSGNNHKVVSVDYAGIEDVYQITVEDNHNYVLENGLVSGNSQIELRLTADEAGEESMIRAFVEGIDLHSLTASEMFDVPLGDVDKQTQRLPAKTINFGIIYGITADGLYRNMAIVKGCGHWTVGLAQNYIDKYFERRPGIRGYIGETEAMAKRYGCVRDWSGRIRRIPGARLSSQYYQAEALRQACNARIQMGAQSIIKIAMAQLVPIYEGWRQMGYHNLSPLIQIHDDIVSMVPEDLLPVLIPVQKEIMEGVRELRSEVRVDVEYGKKWGEMEDW